MSINKTNRGVRTGAKIGAAVIVAVFAAGGVAACAGSGDSASESAAGVDIRRSAPSQADNLAADSPDTANTADRAGDTSDTKDAATTMKRQVISTGEIDLSSRHVARTRTAIMRAVDRWHGTVADEQTAADRHGHVRSAHLTLRVPSARFDDAMSGIAGLAHATHQARNSRDVTTKVIDTDVRVRAKKRAIVQIEKLLDRATSLDQVIRLEGDISERRSELASLEHQQAYLSDQTAMSTITVHLTREHPVTGSTEHAGLFDGFRSGMHAFVVFIAGALTVIGAVAPFAALIALIGVPVWLVRRRRSARADVVDQAG